MAAKARRAEIEVAELDGELVRKRLVINDWGAIGSTLCSHLLGLPARAVPRLILCQNEASMASVLAELVDEHLDELRNAQFTYTDDDEDEPQPKLKLDKRGKNAARSSPGEAGEP
jgi:phage terminase Nu1 subunit (DNA packaging protein)